MKRNLLCLTGTALLLGSCSYSNDPRTGGLFGYWQHGDAGYQSRVNVLQNELSTVEASNVEQARRTSSLQSRKSSLENERARLSQLKEEVRGVPGSVSLMGRIHAAEAGAANDPNLASRVSQLEAEVRALKARQ